MFKTLSRIALQFVFLMLIYSMVRAIFLIYNWAGYEGFETAEVLISLVLGLRFDASSILMLNVPFFLYWLFPLRRDRKYSVQLFFFVNMLFLALNIADIELTKFNGRRLTPHYMLMAQDIGQQMGQLLFHFWYLVLVLAAICYLLVKFFPRPIALSNRVPVFQIVMLYVLFLPVWLLGVRGGTQSRPVRQANAFVFSSPKIGNLALNSSFTFLYARKSSASEHFHFFKDEEMARYKERFRPRASALHGKLKGSNVFVILMESFAREYMGKVNGKEGFTPFLDEFADKALFFKNAYANGRRSIDSVPSLLSGVPALLEEPFLLSGLQNIHIEKYPQKIKQAGYSTTFFHAAKNGSMFFDVFTKRTGIDTYRGLNEYPDELRERDYDGYWGIWDEPYFQQVRKEVNELDPPFMSMMFSLSAHQPYDLPKGMGDKLPKGTLEIHPTVAYSDYSLGKFFKSIEKEDWFENTLFVITADHTSQTDDPKYANQQGEYRIPIIFYHPSFDEWPKDLDQKVIQHVDVLPSVLDLLGIDDNRQVTGRSIFSDSPGFVVNRVPGGFWYADEETFLSMDLKGNFTKTNGDIEKENCFKAYVQYVVNGVNDNKLLEPEPASGNRQSKRQD